MQYAANIAYEDSGISPKQIKITEVHNCFSITEIQMIEAMGFTPVGQGAKRITEGHRLIDGQLPINTGED